MTSTPMGANVNSACRILFSVGCCGHVVARDNIVGVNRPGANPRLQRGHTGGVMHCWSRRLHYNREGFHLRDWETEKLTEREREREKNGGNSGTNQNTTLAKFNARE